MPCYYPLRLPHLEHSVPCGRCIGCRLERSRMWATRCMNEANLHRDNCFITLTYSDKNLPVGLGGAGNPTLWPWDLTKFFKRLRKKYGRGNDGTGIRYFACGEYGTQTIRPHYHACVFNLDFADKIPWQKTGENILYRSESLEKIWGFGHCLIGAVTFESAAYVARYVVEKLNGPAASYYEEQSIEPEFVRMSRRPGIGQKHFELYQSDIYPHDSCVINGVNTKPPRYYDKLLKNNNVKMYENIKNNRIIKSNKISIYEKMPKRLSVKERIALSKLKSRSVI
ncbi:MAG: replication initiator protein [Microviridae sp.]|nr:MAG: replication initiator protein [Microviridae sp.]